jgi:hypothetical protein
MKASHGLSYWSKALIPEAHDIALLRPAHLTKGERFETLYDAAMYSQNLEMSLRRAGGGDYYAEVLSDCRSGYYVCRKPFCALCARAFRRWLFGETRRVVGHQSGPTVIVTPFIRTVDPGDLANVDPRRLKDALRQQMNRAGLDGVIAIGGIEAGFKDGKWLVHGHFAIADAEETGIEILRSFYRGKEAKRPFVVQDLKEQAKQLSYLLKFHSYYRPTKSGYPFPLKPDRALELVQWQSRYDFEDFLFLKGLRRRGARLDSA